MPFGRRMAMHHHQATEPAAPFQERLVDPCPVIAPEFRERCGERSLGRDGGVDAAMNENGVADPHMTFQAVEAREHPLPRSFPPRPPRPRRLPPARHPPPPRK